MNEKLKFCFDSYVDVRLSRLFSAPKTLWTAVLRASGFGEVNNPDLKTGQAISMNMEAMSRVDFPSEILKFRFLRFREGKKIRNVNYPMARRPPAEVPMRRGKSSATLLPVTCSRAISSPMVATAFIPPPVKLAATIPSWTGSLSSI